MLINPEKKNYYHKYHKYIYIISQKQKKYDLYCVGAKHFN
jgi:hypothetical protein